MTKKFGSLRDAYKYFEENGGGGGSISFFSLKNDRESTVVRFLHEGEDDLDWYIIHEVDIQGKRRKVKCTEEGDCPLCVEGNRPQLKIFLQLIDQREPDKVKIWERGRTFIPVVLSFIQRYGALCAQPVEIERLGKPRDTNTTYQLYPLDKDNKTLDQIGHKREQLASENGFILVKNQQDLQAIADGTYVPHNSDDNSQQSEGNFGGQPQNNFGQASNQPNVAPRNNPPAGSDIF